MKITAKLVEEISIKTKKPNEDDACFDAVHTDSRIEGSNFLFIPLVGDRFDGHDFLLQAIKNGATAALWQINKPVPELPYDFQLFFVEDTLKSLHQLAKRYLQIINPIVVAVTGSNGKTTTKDILSSVLSMKYKTYKTQGNYNNHIGLPLTILQMPKDCELVVLEMGMNHFGEISLLTKIAEPHYAVITNIGDAHIEFLGSRAGIAKAKMEIKEGLRNNGKMFVDGDEPLLVPYYDKNVATCGFNKENQMQITSCTGDSFGVTFSVNDEQGEYFLPLLGRHNVKNATYAIAIAKELGLSKEEIMIGLRNVSISKMRFEKIQGKNEAVIINDAYNASPTSMIAAIETIKEIKGFTNRVLVLGDIYELGSDEERLHRSVAYAISEPINYVIAVGEKGKWIGDELRKIAPDIKVDIVLDKQLVAPKLEPMLTKDTIILIKASRGHKLETIVDEIRC